jgi:predicted metal-dependent hydrolase
MIASKISDEKESHIAGVVQIQFILNQVRRQETLFRDGMQWEGRNIILMRSKASMCKFKG